MRIYFCKLKTVLWEFEKVQIAFHLLVESISDSGYIKAHSTAKVTMQKEKHQFFLSRSLLKYKSSQGSINLLMILPGWATQYSVALPVFSRSVPPSIPILRCQWSRWSNRNGQPSLLVLRSGSIDGVAYFLHQHHNWTGRGLIHFPLT